MSVATFFQAGPSFSFSTEWHLKKNKKVIDLGKTAFIPELVLIPENGDKEIYLDVLGFWTPKSLQKKLEEFEAANFKKFIIAASNELRGSREEVLWENENVIFYKTKIEPKVLIEIAEKLLN
jgi:predicted nuclease of restriction endonuclease-like RecB superfamily